MPPAIDYTPYKAFIKDCVFLWDLKLHQVQERLQQEYSVEITTRTLERNLARWGFSSQPKVKDSLDLRAAIVERFYNFQMTDEAIVETLTLEGWPVTTRGLKRLRKRMGLTKRIDPWNEDEMNKEITTVL